MSQKRHAYLIGANGPQGMQLKYAEKDVVRVAEALGGPYCQFARTEVVIADSPQGDLSGFTQFADACDTSDLLLVHFSGHAIFDRKLYLLCNNTNINNLYFTALAIDTIKDILHRSNARYKVLILDCCHAAGAHSGALKGEQDIRGRLYDETVGSAIAILSACSRGARTREFDDLDGGSGFLSWAIREGCTTHFQEASSSPELHVLSLEDLWKRWIPKALEQVNRTLSPGNPLPRPIILNEQECGYGEIWLTDPPPLGQERHAKSDETRRKYLEHVYRRYSSITLPIGPTEGFSLHALFQPLSLRRDPLAAADLERTQRRHLLGEQDGEEDGDVRARVASNGMDTRGGMKQPPQPVLAENGEVALTKSPRGRVVILGGPGTGKTTTLKYLVSCRAKEALSDPNAPVPIFLSLADLARSSKGLQSYLDNVVEEMGVEKSYAEILWKEIERGHAFVALDSLDEVDPALRTRMIDLVNSRASEPGNSWLVGSRFTEYKGGQFKHGQFAEWELLPMRAQLRQELAAKLFPELHRLLSPSLGSSSSPSTFVDVLEKHSHAAAWGENPLLLSLAAVVFVKTGGLPPSRATLYHDVIEAVLTMRVKDSIARKHLLRTLTGLALWLHQSKGRTFTGDDLLTYLEDIQGRRWEETEQIANRIITSGILEVVAHDTYGFRHQTFQEYLAAAELARQLVDQDAATREATWKFAWGKRTYSRWTEVLRLMVGVLAQLPGRKGRSEAMRWISQLVEQRATEEGDPGDLGLALALKSLVEVTEIPEWDTARTVQVEKQVVSLWLGELLDAARNQRKTRRERFQSLAEDIAHLRGRAIESVVGKLVKALRDPHEDVQRIARETLVALRMRVPIELLLKMLQEPDRYVRRAAVEILGGQGDRVPIEALLPLLQEPDSDVRGAAVEVLGGQGDWVSIDALLLSLHSQDANIRQAAVEVLETQNERVPVEIVVELLGDEDEDVRHTTIQILKQNAPHVLSELAPQAMAVLRGEVVGPIFTSLNEMVVADTIRDLGLPSTKLLEILTELLERPHWQVRLKAIQALGQIRRNIPDTAIQRLLQLRRDPDPKMYAVREAADDALAEILSLETGIEDG